MEGTSCQIPSLPGSGDHGGETEDEAINQALAFLILLSEEALRRLMPNHIWLAGQGMGCTAGHWSARAFTCATVFPTLFLHGITC